MGWHTVTGKHFCHSCFRARIALQEQVRKEAKRVDGMPLPGTSYENWTKEQLVRELRGRAVSDKNLKRRYGRAVKKAAWLKAEINKRGEQVVGILKIKHRSSVLQPEGEKGELVEI